MLLFKTFNSVVVPRFVFFVNFGKRKIIQHLIRVSPCTTNSIEQLIPKRYCSVNKKDFISTAFINRALHLLGAASVSRV